MVSPVEGGAGYRGAPRTQECGKRGSGDMGDMEMSCESQPVSAAFYLHISTIPTSPASSSSFLSALSSLCAVSHLPPGTEALRERRFF